MRKFKIAQSITDRQDASLGLFFKDVSKIPMCTAEEEIELSKRIQNGDSSASNRLVEANLRFVISVAKQYQNKGIPLVDLIQSGMLGLIEASKRWNHERGVKFISYAVWWIRQAIIQAISSECRTIRVPMNQVVSMNKINKASEQLEQELNRKPSIEEIADSIETDTDKVSLTLTSITRSVSLDTPFKDEDAGSLIDVVPNKNISSADEELSQDSDSKEIESIINKLSTREGDVIRMVFGLDGIMPMTLEEIACRFGIGSERVRQIQHGAIERLRMNFKDELSKIYVV